jgi:Nif-specific regulatory protein
MIKIEALSGQKRGTKVESETGVLRIGRADGNDLLLTDDHVSGDHARVQTSGEQWVLHDLKSTNGTAVVRGGERHAIEDGPFPLEHGDVIELGHGDKGVRLAVSLQEEDEEEDNRTAQVLAMRSIDDIPAVNSNVEQDTTRLRALYEAQKRIGEADDLSDVLAAIADSVLVLVPRATHVTMILRDDDEDPAAGVSGYVPVMTRVRGQSQPSGPIPITRSVFRKVITERAAVVAADAPREVANTESLMGASIRSTMAVPFWKRDEILGVLQLDNRESAGVFTSQDLELITVLAHHASLAVANARLVKRLKAAEERARKENQFLKGREQERRLGAKGGSKQEIIGQSASMRTLLGQLDKVVDTRVTVLIEGETGAGKELVAAAVHYRSRRRDKLFVSQNCAAMPENLLESELFGHKKGSFTGAHEDKKGLFEIADGGTLFLDEVTEMPLSLQSKLLRALQEGEIRPIGATAERKVDVRIVAATNRNLEKEVAEGRFREDLYYRLKVFPLRVPPLRERRDDVPLIANHFLARFSQELGKPAGGFSQQAMELLTSYEWPGNVRELQNEIQRLVIQIEAGGFVTPELLSPRVRQVEGMVDRVRPTKGTLKEMMEQVERWLLIEALREHGNNKTAAARALGITREGLHKKLRAYGL